MPLPRVPLLSVVASRSLATAWLLAAAAAPAPAAAAGGLDPALLEHTVEAASALPRLHALIVARDGSEIVAQAFRGPGLDEPVNVKSVSKTVIAALVGIAIGRGLLDGIDQPIVPLLGERVPEDAGSRLEEVTIGHLLAMRAGLERTSGPNYGAWVHSRNWVDYVLTRPFVDEPGGRMLYSTGNSHLLSAIVTRVTGRSTLELARDWLGEPLAITVPAWTQDPQGVYFGGNEMALSPRALLRLGELYRNGGVVDGQRVLPEGWVEASWTRQERSPHTGHHYGYGWFISQARGHPVYYAWGYGGQMIYVIPDLALTVVITSDHTAPSRGTGYLRNLHELLAEGLVPAAENGDETVAEALPANGS